MKAALARAIGRAAVRLGTRRPRPRRAPAPAEASFEVFTFVTDEARYEEMRRSFEAGGFTRFTRLSDRETDPYAFIAQLGVRDAHAVLVHQDVLLGPGSSAARLAERLAALDEGWVVAGNAGGTPDLRLVRRLRDPYGGSTGDELPVQATTLDENFLVLNAHRAPRTTPGLHGFHLYGADVALNALRDGGTAWIVDFPVVHLSGGTKDVSFEAAKRRFVDAWNARTTFAYVRTPTGFLFLSRSALLRRLFGSPRALSWVQDVSPALVLLEDEPEAGGER